ncbi:hypothetical protein NS226_19585, partial [Aureimonas ureilytica]
MIIEPVEPRLLMSGTPLSAAAAATHAMADNLAHFEAVLDSLESFQAFGNDLALIEVSGNGPNGLGHIAELAQFLKANIVAPMGALADSFSVANATLPGDSGALAQSLQDAINKPHVTITDRSDANSDVVDFDVSIRDHDTKGFHLDLGAVGEAWGIQLPSSLSGSLGLDYDISLRFTFDQSDHTFSIQAASVGVDFTADLSIPDGVGFNLGLLELNIGNGTNLHFSGGVDASFSLIDGNTLSQKALQAEGGANDFLNDLVRLNAHESSSGGPLLVLPVGLSAEKALPGLGALNGSIEVHGGLLGGDWSAQVSGLDALKNFSTFTTRDLLSVLTQLGSHLASIEDSPLFDIAIPFTHGTKIGDVLSFMQHFDADVLAKLGPVNETLGFTNGASAKAASGSAAASLTIDIPEHFNTALPAVFHLNLQANGTIVSLELSDHYENQANQRVAIETLDDFVNALNAAIHGSELSSIAAASAVNGKLVLTAVATGNADEPAAVSISAPGASFDNLLEFAQNLGTALGYGQTVRSVQQFLSDLGFAYDAAQHSLTFSIGYATDYTVADGLAFDVGFDLGTIAGLSGSGVLSLHVSAGLGLMVGIDIGALGSDVLVDGTPIHEDTLLAHLPVWPSRDVAAGPGEPDMRIILRDGTVADITYEPGTDGAHQSFKVQVAGATTIINGSGPSQGATIADLLQAIEAVEPGKIDAVFNAETYAIEIHDSSTRAGTTPLSYGFTPNQGVGAAKLASGNYAGEYQAQLTSKAGDGTDWGASNSFILKLGTLDPMVIEIDAASGRSISSLATAINAALSQIQVARSSLGLADGAAIHASQLVSVSVVQDAQHHDQLRFSTTMFNVVSANATQIDQRVAAKAGITLQAVDTTVWSMNGSGLATTLGLAGMDRNASSASFGLIAGKALHGETIANRFFFDNVGLTAALDLQMSDLVLTGSLGFLGFQAEGEGHVSLQATLALQHDGSSRVTFADLASAYNNDRLSDLWALRVGAPDEEGPWAELVLSHFSVTGAGALGDLASAIGANAAITIRIDTPLTSAASLSALIPQVEIQGFDRLTNISDLGFADVVDAIKMVLDLIDNHSGGSIMAAEMPLIDMSVSDILDLTSRFAGLVDTLQADPASGVAEIQAALNAALGSNIHLGYVNGTLTIAGSLDAFSVDKQVGFAVDLADLARSAGLSLPPMVTELASASGSGLLHLAASATLGLSVGIRLGGATATSEGKLALLNGGKGLASDKTGAADLRFTLGDGSHFDFDMDSLAANATMSDLVVALNRTAGAAGITHFSASFADGHIVLTDTSRPAVSPPPGLTELGFSTGSSATQHDGRLALTSTAPGANFDPKQAYRFDLVVNGQAYTLDIPSDEARTSLSAMASAIELELGTTFVTRAELGLSGSGKALLSQFVSVEAGNGKLTLSADAARLGSSASLALAQSLYVAPEVGIVVSDLGGGKAAASLGFAVGHNAAFADGASDRVLTGSGLVAAVEGERFFIDTENTGLDVRFGVSGTELQFNSSLGPLSISVDDGMARLGAAVLDASGQPVAAGHNGFGLTGDDAFIHVGLHDGAEIGAQGGMAGRLTLGQISGAASFASLFEVSSNVAVEVSLPVSVLGMPLAPALTLEISDVLGTSDLGRKVELALPDWSSSFSVVNFLNSPQAVISGLDGLLGTVDTLLTEQILGFKLPLVGSALSHAGEFVGDLRASTIGYLQGLVDDYSEAHPGEQPTTAGIIADGLEALLHKLGFAATVASEVNLATSTILFDLDAAITVFHGGVDLSSDFGIPGLGLSIQNGKANLDLDLELHLDFGFSLDKGFFFQKSLADEHALQLAFTIDLPDDFSASLTLGILQATATNAQTTIFHHPDGTQSTGTSLSGGIFVDLAPKNRLSLIDLGATHDTIHGAVDGNHTLTLDLPDALDVKRALSFQIVIDDKPIAIDIAADTGRSHLSDLVAAISRALHATTIDTGDILGHGGGRASLDTLVDVRLSGTQLTFAAKGALVDGDHTLALADTVIGLSSLGSHLRAELAASLDVNLQLTGAIDVGGSMALPSVTTEVVFQYQIEKVFLGYATGETGVVVPLSFKNVTLDAGAFLTKFLGPILDTAYDLVKPIKPILDMLTEPLSGVSDIMGRPVSLLDLAELLGGHNPKVAKIIQAVEMIDQVADLIESIHHLSAGGNLRISFGDFVFGAATVGTGAVAGAGGFDPFSGSLKTFNTGSVRTLGSMSQQGDDAGGVLAKAKNPNASGGISLPILTDPMAVMKLLMGQGAAIDLFKWDLPEISFDFQQQMHFPLVGIPGINLGADLGIGFGIQLKLSIGYDTSGIMQFIDTHNPLYVMDGLYVDNSAPQVTAYFKVMAGASIDLTLIQAGLAGEIKGTIAMQLSDPNHDGRVRPSEIMSKLLHDPLETFTFSGEVDARFFAWWWVGFKLFGAKVTLFSGEWDIFSATLVKFDTTPAPEPTLANTQDGTLTLSVGALAGQRLQGDTSTGSDKPFVVEGHADGSVTVSFDGTSKTYADIDKITADLGDGDNHIILSGIDKPIVITGGNGNNRIDLSRVSDPTIVLGDGDNIVLGSQGFDDITVGNGNNIIAAGGGDDVIRVGTGRNIILGDSGVSQYDSNGKLRAILASTAADGNDQIIVQGSGESIIFGDSANVYLDDAGVVTSITASSVAGGNDTIRATNRANNLVFGDTGTLVFSGTRVVSAEASGVAAGGNDTITLGSGDNVVFGGLGNDLIDVGSGNNVVLGDIGRVTYSATGVVATAQASSSQGGGDKVTAGYGHNILFGGAGDDTLTGGNGTNVIIGDTGSADGPGGGSGGSFRIATTDEGSGNDSLTGGAYADVILGGMGNDTITGLSGADVIAGDNGVVVRSGAAIGKAAIFQSFGVATQTAGGTDEIDGGSGGDIIIAGSGDDSIDGGSGQNYMLGDFGRVVAEGAAVMRIEGFGADSAGSGADRFEAGDGNNVAMGGGGDDQIALGKGVNLIFGDNGLARQNRETSVTINGETVEEAFGGDDTVLVGPGTAVVFGGAGADILSVTSSDPRILPSDFGRNVLVGDFGAMVTPDSAHPDVIGRNAALASNGIDLITIDGGQNVVMGGGKGDVIRVRTGNNVVFGDAGALTREAVSLRVLRAETADEASGGNDVIAIGDGGNNVVMGGASDDTISIGSGSGNIAFGDFGVTLAPNGTAPDAVGRHADAPGNGRDTITIVGGRNVVMGGGEADRIDVGSSDNVIFGDAGALTREAVSLRVLRAETADEASGGNDVIAIGDGGNNVVMGGASDDTISIGSGSGNIAFGDFGVTLAPNGTAADAVGRHADAPGNGRDTITIVGGRNVVMGGGEADRIDVGSSDNVIFGDAGALTREAVSLRVLRAETADEASGGNDVIAIGEGGNNVVMGGASDDTISIGSGSGNLAVGDFGVTLAPHGHAADAVG